MGTGAGPRARSAPGRVTYSSCTRSSSPLRYCTWPARPSSCADSMRTTLPIPWCGLRHVDDRKPVQKRASRLHSQQDALPVRLGAPLEVPICGHRASLRAACPRHGHLPHWGTPRLCRCIPRDSRFHTGLGHSGMGLAFLSDVCKRDQLPSELWSVLITTRFGSDRERACPGVLTSRAPGQASPPKVPRPTREMETTEDR